MTYKDNKTSVTNVVQFPKTPEDFKRDTIELTADMIADELVEKGVIKRHTAEVFSLEDYAPHLSGNMVCLQCKHEWVGVAPVGTVYVECPDCETNKGVFTTIVHADPSLVCSCGCTHFSLTANWVATCMLCGVDHYPEDGVE